MTLPNCIAIKRDKNYKIKLMDISERFRTWDNATCDFCTNWRTTVILTVTQQQLN